MTLGNHNLKTVLVFLFVCLLLTYSKVIAQQAPIAQIIKELDEAVLPITSLIPNNDLSDLPKLNEILKNKSIVALGEATHGTSEFFTVKHRLVEYLVTQMNFRIFVIEGDFAGAKLMNDYITTRTTGTIDSALKSMAVGFWFTQEFVDLINWMKQYNQDKLSRDQIKFYGCDMQFAFTSATLLLNGSIRLKNPLSEKALLGLTKISKYGFGNISKDDKQLMIETSVELNATLHQEEDSLTKQYINTFLQTIEYATQNYLFNKDIVRDKYMARNSEWIYNHEGKRKMIIWAHNLHIAKDFPGNSNILPMGGHLAKTFPQDYYALGFGFDSGTLRGYDPLARKAVNFVLPSVAIKNSTDFIFSQSSMSNFILDFQRAYAFPSLNSVLNERLHVRSIGGQYKADKQAEGKDGTYQKLGNLYDGIIFIRNTTASHEPVYRLTSK